MSVLGNYKGDPVSDPLERSEAEIKRKEELPVFESKILKTALAFLRFSREMNANVRSEVSTE